MSFVSKIGHLDPRLHSLIYCGTGGPDFGGPDFGGPDSRCPTLFPKLDISTPIAQSYILCDTGGPDVGVQMSRRGPDIGGQDVRFPYPTSTPQVSM